MCRNRSHPQANFCKCLATQTSVKERNSQLPVYVQSDRTGMMEVSQQHLNNTYPVLFNDLRRSGNRVVNPIDRIAPYFTSSNDYERCTEASELIISTLRNKSSLSPICPGFGYDPILEDHLMRMNDAAALGDPFMLQVEYERLLGLLEAFSALTGSLGRNDALIPRLNPRFQNIGPLGPNIDLLVREMSLRFLVSIAEVGVEGVFQYLRVIHRLTGNNTERVRRLIEALRVDEQRELYSFAEYMAQIDQDHLAEKIIRMLQGLPADANEYRTYFNRMGY